MGRFSGGELCYPRVFGRSGGAPEKPPPNLRSMGRARAVPGAMRRMSDTRVRLMPAVTSRGSNVSVAYDNAERPVHDRSSPAAVEVREVMCSS
jgi:hypothetical protein